MEFNIAFSNGEVSTVECPTTFYAMNTGDYQRLYEEWHDDFTADGMVKAFSILTGRQSHEYEQSEDALLELHILNATKFLYTENLSVLKVPKHFMGKDIGETDMMRMSLGKNLNARKILSGKDMRCCIAGIVANYMQTVLSGDKFDEKKVVLLEDKIKLMPITETFALGFFFVQQLSKRGKEQTNYLRQIWKTIETFGRKGNPLLNLQIAKH